MAADLPCTMSQRPLRLAAPGLDVAIASAAPEAAARFYTELLGADPVADPAPWRAAAAVRFGGQVIAFREAATHSRSQPGGIYDAVGLRVIGLRVADLDSICAGLMEAGHRVADAGALPGQRPIRFAKDVDGCMLELIGAGSDVSARPRLQVGLTVADADASRSFYRDELGFPEQPPAPISKKITRFGFDVGGSTLKLWQPTRPAAPRPPETEPGLQAILLRLQLPEATGKREVSPQPRTLQDPDANPIELIPPDPTQPSF
jgi:catechol 2,3-dioxygenase-like lactoylglutathione lyase family enzyme